MVEASTGPPTLKCYDTHSPVWMETVPAVRQLGVTVHQLYAAIGQGRVPAPWVQPALRVEVAVDDDTPPRCCPATRRIAAALEAGGHRPRRGDTWHPSVVARIVGRLPS